MSLLNFNKSEPKRSGEKKSLAILVGIGALVGVIALGSTLAASINLNGGAPVEFGQGVAQTTACDSDGITLTPASTFFNGSYEYYGAESTFYFSSLSVSGVSDNCSGVTFKVRAYMNGNDEPLYWPAAPNEDSFEFGFIVNGDWTSVDSCMRLDNQVTGISNNNSVTIDWTDCVPSDAAFAGSVDRITIESSVNPNSGVFPTSSSTTVLMDNAVENYNGWFDNWQLTSGATQWIAFKVQSSSPATVTKVELQLGSLLGGDLSGSTVDFYSDGSLEPNSDSRKLGTLTYSSIVSSGSDNVATFTGSVSIPSASTYWFKFGNLSSPTTVWYRFGGVDNATGNWTPYQGTGDSYDFFDGGITGDPGYYPRVRITGVPIAD
ncbi:unannotated protein [freshwater metagenome]|uniref:Unannotated protein n=1 Tax=freshwater metagenome TaxID=449393 RepID=A0A6J6UES3_9ZZZZ|nr:hypothetical protein [Actinomycetota bacterium]